MLKMGQVIGSVSVRVDGKEIGRYDLLAGADVDKMTFFRAFLRLLHGLTDLKREDLQEKLISF